MRWWRCSCQQLKHGCSSSRSCFSREVLTVLWAALYRGKPTYRLCPSWQVRIPTEQLPHTLLGLHLASPLFLSGLSGRVVFVVSLAVIFFKPSTAPARNEGKDSGICPTAATGKRNDPRGTITLAPELDSCYTNVCSRVRHVQGSRYVSIRCSSRITCLQRAES